MNLCPLPSFEIWDNLESVTNIFLKILKDMKNERHKGTLNKLVFPWHFDSLKCQVLTRRQQLERKKAKGQEAEEDEAPPTLKRPAARTQSRSKKDKDTEEKAPKARAKSSAKAKAKAEPKSKATAKATAKSRGRKKATPAEEEEEPEVAETQEDPEENEEDEEDPPMTPPVRSSFENASQADDEGEEEALATQHYEPNKEKDKNKAKTTRKRKGEDISSVVAEPPTTKVRRRQGKQPENPKEKVQKPKEKETKKRKVEEKTEKVENAAPKKRTRRPKAKAEDFDEDFTDKTMQGIFLQTMKECKSMTFDDLKDHLISKKALLKNDKTTLNIYWTKASSANRLMTAPGTPDIASFSYKGGQWNARMCAAYTSTELMVAWPSVENLFHRQGFENNKVTMAIKEDNKKTVIPVKVIKAKLQTWKPDTG